MKVFACENDDYQVVKVFSSLEKAEDFQKKENERQLEWVSAYRNLSDRNPGKNPEILKNIRAGKAKEIPELKTYMEECQEFNKKYGTVDKIFNVQEYEVE